MSYRVLTAVALVASWLGLSPSSLAQAGANVQHLRVQSDNGVCTYHLKDQPSQAEFTIVPDGKLIFQPVGGVRATAIILPSESNVSGTQGSNWVILGSGGDRTLDVREAIGYDTEHEIQIQCCTEREGSVCSSWQYAVASSADFGSNGHVPDDRPMSGPSAAAPDVPVVSSGKTGGPRMKVDE